MKTKIIIVLILVASIVGVLYAMDQFLPNQAHDRENENKDEAIGKINEGSENSGETEEPLQPEEEPVDQIKAQLDKMTLDEKIGQLLFVGIDGLNMDQAAQELLQTYKVGGIILFKRNIGNVQQTINLLNQLKESNSSNPLPLFLGVDEEGGRVSRMPKEFIPVPAMKELAQANDSRLIRSIGQLTAKKIQALGFNLDFAPVLDIHSNPQNQVIGDRSFGSEPQLVSRLGLAMMQGLAEQGVIPVIKHFPGHGDTALDSHVGLPILEHDLSRLDQVEMIPFKEAIKQGADMVMVAHILLPTVDEQYPASLSEAVISQLLRAELGFDGVVITDDLVMGAITKNYGVGEAAVQAILAGSDIVLVGHEFEQELVVIKALRQAAEEGRLSPERIDESVYRILQLKEKYQLSDTPVESIDVEQLNREMKAELDKVLTR